MIVQFGACNSPVFKNFYSTAVKTSPLVKSPIVQQCSNPRLTQSAALSESKSSFWKAFTSLFKRKPLTVAALTSGIAVGQTVKKNVFMPFMSFTPARSVKEAKYFGEKYLGIKSYEGIDNLELMNYVNEGLFDTVKATKGQAVLPTVIKGLSKDIVSKDSPMSAVTKKNGERILQIHKKFFKKRLDKSLKKTYKEMIKKGYISKKGNKYFLTAKARNGRKTLIVEKTIGKLFNSNKKLTLKEKMSLTSLCDNMTSFSNNNINTNSPMAAIRNICDGMGKDSFILNGKNYSVADIERMNISAQQSILDSMLQNGMHYEFVQNPTCYIAHEVGHLQHANNVGYKNFYEMFDAQCKNKKQTEQWAKQGVDVFKGQGCVQYFRNSFAKQSVAAEVSERAKDSPLEFVAEVYSKLLEGKTFSPSVMNMYREYGGSIPNIASIQM